MNTATTCPVCGFVQPEDDPDTCSQCDADLVCFRLLDTLSTPSPLSESEQPHPPLPEPADDGSHEPRDQGNGSSGKKDVGKTLRKTRFLVIPLLILLLMVLAAGYAGHRFEILTAAVQTLTTELQKTGAGIETLQGQMADIPKFSRNAQDSLTRLDRRVEKAVEQIEKKLEKRVAPGAPETSPPVAKPCLKTTRATDTDTLWTISRNLYGTGKYYPVLMACNPNLDVFTLSSRQTIAHPCDKKTADGIYRRITAVKHNRWFWKYLVQVGDTPQSIAKRFCSHPADCFVDSPPFEPGTTIGIYLE